MHNFGLTEGGASSRLVSGGSLTSTNWRCVDLQRFFDGSLYPLCTPFVQSTYLEVNMKMVKSLILGSAAALVAMSGAQAADLPVKAKAVEYVKVCSLYGAGFFYIPGTDTCIKLGG